MRFSLMTTVAVALVGLSAASVASSTSYYSRQSDFIRAMKAATQDDAEVRRQIADIRRLRQKERKARFQRNLMAKAVPRHEVEAKSAAAAGVPEFMSKSKPTAATRRLDQQEEEVDYGAFGFDPSAYSLKYTACSAISLYSDQMAEEDEALTVTIAKKFVVFRLCPTESCSSSSDEDSWTSTSVATASMVAQENTYGSSESTYDGSAGCGSSYGEYLIPLDVYIQEYAQYKEEASNAYCEYCEQCMYFEKYFYGNYRRDLDGDQMDDDAYAAYAADDDNNGGEQHACKYYTQCENYLDVCDGEEEAADDDQAQQQQQEEEEFDYEGYFECQQWDDGNNNNNYNGNQYYYNGLYIGPRCAEDGFTIEFGVYSDQYCSNYIGDTVSVDDVTGMNSFGADYLSGFYDQQCISCKASDLPYMVAQGDQQDDDDITELCEAMYEQSAKCNVNLEDAQSSYMYANQYANEDLACSFIQNVVKGMYDQNGYVIIDQDEFDITKLFQNWSNDVAPTITQIFAIIILGVACSVMLITACFMKRSVNKWDEAKRRRALVESDAGGGEDPYAINRADSGVMVGRSFSREYPDGAYVMT